MSEFIVKLQWLAVHVWGHVWSKVSSSLLVDSRNIVARVHANQFLCARGKLAEFSTTGTEFEEWNLKRAEDESWQQRSVDLALWVRVEERPSSM